MGLFSNKHRRSSALIDIGSSSVGGALARLESGQVPQMYYTARVPVEIREIEGKTEDPKDAVLRALIALDEKMVREGAPVLKRATGSGHVDHVVVSIAAPWQQTLIRTETIQEERPFVFSQSLMDTTVRKTVPLSPDRIASGESVIATMLNGYEIGNPFGKKAKRADMIVLSSSIDKELAHAVTKQLRKSYHTHDIGITAFAPVTYSVFRDIYQHEKDYVVLDVSGEGTDLAFVKHGILTSVANLPQGVNQLLSGVRAATRVSVLSVDPARMNMAEMASLPDSGIHTRRLDTQQVAAVEAWLMGLVGALRSFMTRHALPRTLFLLADDSVRDFLRRHLDAPQMRALWLTEEPLSILPVLPEHLSHFVHVQDQARGDVSLELLALYENKQMGNYTIIETLTPKKEEKPAAGIPTAHEETPHPVESEHLVEGA
jgi:hypothetical protein